MSFIAIWHDLLEELEALPPAATLETPVSRDRFRIADVQEHRVVVEFEGSGERRPLQRDQFETLYYRIEESDGFALDRLPPDADPYPAVLSLHPRFAVDPEAGTIRAGDGPTGTQLVEDDRGGTPASIDGGGSASGASNANGGSGSGVDAGGDDSAIDDGTDGGRTEPDGVDVYADALLVIDALERHDVSALDDLETGSLVDLYTLLSDVQRSANDLRREIADVLLDRLGDDRPVSGQYGSVQRTSRRDRTLKPDGEVRETLAGAGIDPERVTSVDPEKVDDALEVTTLTETDVYEVDEREYVRKADVDEDEKATRLQGLRDRLARADDAESEALRREIEDLERRIDDLTSFRAGTDVRG